MHTRVSFLQRQCSSILKSMFANRTFNLLKTLQFKNVYILLIALGLASSAAHGQSSPGQATISFSYDQNNCTYTDSQPELFLNQGQVFITINNTEIESAAYECQAAGSAFDFIQNLANAINQHSTFVTASVLADNFDRTGSILLTARTTGDSTNYPLAVEASWDSAVAAFTGPTYVPSAPTSLSGGAIAGEVVYPSYQVQSIIYATPGNRSSNGFTNATTDGTTTSIGKSLQLGNTVTFTIGGNFFGIGSTMSWSYGTSSTSGDTTSVTSTITQATGVANATGGSAPDAIDHHQDLFVIWLNPAVEIIQTGNTTGTFSVGTQSQVAGDPSPGQPQIQDQVEVFASTMTPNAQGQTSVPLQALVPQVISGQHLPGLGNICANKTIYPNSCTQANQCGCVPSDFAPILAQDPLLNFGSTDNPLNADTSGPTACTNPSSAAKCRYVPVMVANGSSAQVTELLAGPQSVGGNIPFNTFTQTDSTQTAHTLSENVTTTVGYSINRTLQVPMGPSFGLGDAKTWTWGNSESTGAINGTANTMAVTLGSATVDCFQNIPVFEDTVFHTFVFQQPTGNNSCSVPLAPSFSLVSSPNSQTVTAGGNTTYTLSTTAQNGFAGTVALALAGLPTGASGTFSPTSITGSGSSTLTVSTTSSTPQGSYTVTVTGTSGSLVQTANVTIVVNASGSVTISAPANNSNQSTSVRVTASATETGTTIAQMQVWDNTTGVRLGINNGSTIDQTYTLAAGTHQIIVEDLAAGTFAVIHTSSVTITVFADGVHITAPANNASITGPVHVTGFATEAATQIAQMQVWDNTTGVRLGINNGSTIDQTYTLATGTHQIIMEDLEAGTFAVIHTASVTVTVH
jgi:hypothetical protein